MPVFRHISLVTLLLFTIPTNAQNWKLSKDKNGIVVYTAETGSSYKMFKGEMTIDANIHGLIYLLKDADKIPEWMFKVDEFEIYVEEDEKQWMSWTGIDMPWPVDNRDVVTWQVLKKTEKGFLIEISSAPDKMKERQDFVRLRVSKGYWAFEETTDGKVKVTYQFQTEPEGIPAWVVNLLIVDSPYNTLLNMRDLIKEEPYKSINLPYLD